MLILRRSHTLRRMTCGSRCAIFSGYVNLLERRYTARLDDDARQFIGFVRDGADRLDRLVSSLLNFSRATRQESRLRPVVLRDVVQEGRR